MMRTTEMLEKSAIIVAHPDDEVLWFSSILDKVKEILICFLGNKSQPHWEAGRKKCLSEYPMKKISCLGIDESEVFNGANWQNPVIAKYGIEISKKNFSCKLYMENYYKLKQFLKNKLADCHNVFTHNPWGEYGNEEHIQVYRVIKELRDEMKYNLWFSNYCSNKSFHLMLRHIAGFNSEYKTLNTNNVLGKQIKEIYKRNGCWTWYDDWEWFNEESFMKDGIYEETSAMHGHIFPLNMIKMELPAESKGIFGIFRTIIAKILRDHKKK